jgi:hypothetical protein
MARLVQVIDSKSGRGVEHQLEQGVRARIAVSPASSVRIGAPSDHVAALHREGDDLVIELVDGTTLHLEDYFNCTPETESELLFVDGEGQMWRTVIDAEACYPTHANETERLAASFEPVAKEAGAAAAGWGWTGWALAGAGVIGAAAAASGGGGGGSQGDHTAPAAPTVDASNGSTLSGQAEAGSTIRIDLDGDGVADLTTTADSNGRWTVTPSTPLPDGRVVEVVAVDPAGNTSPPTKITVDAMPPAPPVLNPTDGASLSGTAEPGSTVAIDLDGDGVPDVHVTTGADGTWSVPLDAPIPDGTVITATATDPVGNTSGQAQTSVNNSVPSFGGAGDDVGPVTGPLSNGDATDDTRPTFSGSGAKPNGTVNIYDNGVLIGTTTADSSGDWTFTPSTDLGEGSHDITFSNVDAIGTEGPQSAPFTITIDTSAPTVAPTLGGVTDDVAPKTGLVVAGEATNDTRPTFAGGGAEPNSTVNVYDNGILIGAVPVDGNGNWTFTPENDLGEGAHSITFSNVDAAGNEGPQSTTPFTFTVDTDAPTTAPTFGGTLDDVGPYIGPVADGGLTDDARPTFNGSGAEPNSSVNVYDNGVLIGSAPVDGNGNWSFTPTDALGDGAHSITFSNVDAAGNEGPQSATPFTFNVDATAPTTAPIVGGVEDDVGDKTGPMASGTTTDDPRPAFAGSGAEPNSTVNIYDNGVLIDTVPVDANGDWTYTPAVDLIDGSHSLTFSNVDEAGNEGPRSTPFTFTVDTEAPTTAPTLGGVSDDVAPVIDLLDEGDPTNDPRPTFAGSGAEPNSTVNIYDGGVLIGTVPVDENGEWSFTPLSDLSEGAHSITFSNVDAAGNEGPQSATPFTFTVDTLAPTSAPTLSGVADDELPITTPVQNGGATNDPRPDFTGSGAEPGTTVNVYDNGTLIASVLVDANGDWSFTPPGDLSEGVHSFQFSNVDEASNEGPRSAPFGFTVDTEAPTSAPTLGSVNDDVAPVTGPLSATDATTNDPRPTFAGSGAEPNTTVNVYDAGVLIGSTTVDAAGNWSFTPSVDLGNGPHSITFSNVDAAGNEGPESTSPFEFTVDRIAPASAPTLGGVFDDVGPGIGPLNTGDATNDPRPTFTGTGAEPDSTVNVYSNGVLVGTATADADGEWEFTPSADWTDGTYNITFSNVDAAGNEGPQSPTPFVIKIDTQAPSAKSYIDSIYPDTGDASADFLTFDVTPTLYGHLDGPLAAGERLQLSIDGGGWIDIVPEGTNWTYSLADPLGNGPHNFETRVVTASGLESEVNLRVVTVDVQPPPSIEITHITPDSEDADFVTSSSSVTVHGTIGDELGGDERVEISLDGGTTWQEVTVAGTSWSYADPRTLGDGTYEYLVRTIDNAGNITPASSPLTVTVDTAPPAGIEIDGIANDSGRSASDLITNETSITLNGHLNAPLAAGEVAQISNDGGLTWIDITNVTDSQWTYAEPNPLADGDYEYLVRVVDTAGNASPTTSRTITVDTTPPGQPNVPTFVDSIEPISGPISHGSMTNDASPELSGVAPPNSIVRVYVSYAGGAATLAGEVLADESGNWTFAPTGPLDDGVYDWTVTYVDEAGNEGDPSDPFQLEIKTELPADSVIEALTGDSGAFGDDFITNNPDVELTGSFTQALLPGEVAYISINGGPPTALDAQPGDSTWSFSDLGLADGVYYYEVYVQDGGGQVGASDTKKIVIDTTPPGAITIDAIGSDTGADDGDMVTSATSISLSGSLSAPLATGDVAETAQISTDNGATWTDLAVNGTSWTFLDPTPRADGTVNYQVRIVDRAGNVGPIDTQAVTIDTTPPPAATITAISPDEGVVGDYITSATSVRLRGTVANELDPGELVQVSVDGGASWADAVAAGTEWFFDDPRTLADGSYVYQVRTIDLAGNVTAGGSRTVIIDTTDPTQLVYIDSISDDTGALANDFLTSDDSPSIQGHLSAGLGVGESVEVSLDGGVTWNTAAVAGTSWSYIAGPLGEGVYTIDVRVIDAAGNIGSTANRGLTIDLTPPAAATITHLLDAVGEITGPLTSGSATDDSSPLLEGTLPGAEAGSQLRIYDGATLLGTVTLTAGQTAWSYQLSNLADGPHSLSVVVVDAAGLESTPATFEIEVDTTPPAVTTLTIDAIDTDTHATNALDQDSDGDFVTRDTTLTVSGTANFEPGATLQISSDGGVTWVDVTTASGPWLYTDPTPRTSDVTYQVRVVDSVGNVSPVTDAQTVVVDVSAPPSGLLAPVLAPAYDTGTIGDNVTKTQNITFSSTDSGEKDASSSVLLVHDVNGNGIFDAGIDIVLAEAATPGAAWSLSASLAYGTWSLGFLQVDAAGNYSRLSPTTNISVYAADDHEAGDFTGSSPMSTTSYHVGMGSGINRLGELQLTVRRVVITQTSQSGGVNTVPDNPAPSASTVTNNTFLDFNRDGYVDYATSDNVWSDLKQSIYVGQSDGTYSGYRQAVGTNAALGGIVAFDKEGDGYLEVVWGDWGGDSPPGYAVNNSGALQNGVLVPGTTVYVDREMSGVDIDNDGDVDLAFHTVRAGSSTNAYAFTLFSNDGSGQFSIGQSLDNIFNNTLDTAGDAVSMTWADFDGDGDLDLYLNRTRSSDVSGIFLNEGGQLSSVKNAIGDTSTALAGSASLAIDWNHDGRMDVIEFARPNTTGPIQLYLNTTNRGGALNFDSTVVQLATGIVNIGGVAAVDYDWDGDVDIVYQTSTNGQIRSIENLNQVEEGTSLHLRILDREGFNVFYGNTVQLFDSAGNLVATQILNPQSGVGTNDSTGIVNFYGLSANETYTVALVRTVNGVSQDVSGVASLIGGAANLSTVEVVNSTWTGLRPGAANTAYVLSTESNGEANDGWYAGTGYNDTFFGTDGDDSFVGGGGWSIGIAGPSVWSATGGMDIVDYQLSSSGVTVFLFANTASGQGLDALIDIEGIRGSAFADTLVDSIDDNLFEGRGGDDIISLQFGGRDIVQYRLIDENDATGGNGSDVIEAFTVARLDANANADVLDLRDLLKGYTGTANVYWDVTQGEYVLDYASRGLLQYLNVTVSGADTLIQVDLSGTGNFTTVATLDNVQTSLEELLGNQQLWLASSQTLPRVTVNAISTADDTPIVTGSLPFALDAGQELRVQINGVTYSSANLNEVVVDPLNNRWYVQVAAPLAAGTYSVTASVINGDGSLAMLDRTSGELTVTSTPEVTFGGAGGASNKATALTLGENGVWRIFSNDTVYDSQGVASGSLGSYSSRSITVSGQNTQNATFMDYNRDGYMDIFGIDQDYSSGQQSWTYDGSTYSPFEIGGSGVTSAKVWSWYGGIAAYDKFGSGYVGLIYGDETPNDASAGGGYDTQFVLNNGGVFIKDGAYVDSTGGTPAPTNTGNATPDKEISGVDINNDGTVDIVYHANLGSNYRDATRATQSTNDYRLVVVTNVGDGALYSSQVIDNVFYNYSGTDSYAPSMTWADFNGDGYMDLFLGRGRFTSAGAVSNTTESRILYNDHGTLVQSLTGDYATTFLGDSVQGGASLALDWNLDGRMDVIELPEYDAPSNSTVNLYTNDGGGVFTTTSLANIPSSERITGAVALDLDWDGDKDLLFFRSSGVTTYISNDSAPTGGTLHLRIVDEQGINVFYGNTVQLYDSAGNWVASQIINPQSGLQTNDSTAIVDFHGLDANETYTAVMLAHTNGASNDVGGIAVAGGNTIERVNATWTNLRVGAANEAYVLTAESDSNIADTIGPGIVGTGYNDRLFATQGNDVYNGGGGWHNGEWSNTRGEDIVDFVLAGNTAVTVDLSKTTAQNTGFNTATFINIEGVAGGAGNDVFTGNAADNFFEGRGGDDLIHLGLGGQDTVLFRLLEAADATGGNGADTITGFKVGLYESTPGADRIDLRELLIGYAGDADGAAHYVNGVATLDAGDAIADYLQVTNVAGNTVISIDRDGAGIDFDFEVIATLDGVSTSLETLLANHQLVVA